MGEPGDGGRHREVALAALALLHELEEPGETALSFLRFHGGDGAI